MLRSCRTGLHVFPQECEHPPCQHWPGWVVKRPQKMLRKLTCWRPHPPRLLLHLQSSTACLGQIQPPKGNTQFPRVRAVASAGQVSPAIRSPWAGETSQHHQGKRPSSDRRPFRQKFQGPQQGGTSRDFQQSPPERTGGGDRRREKVRVVREGTPLVPLLG